MVLVLLAKFPLTTGSSVYAAIEVSPRMGVMLSGSLEMGMVV